jgi:hypothetical protein
MGHKIRNYPPPPLKGLIKIFLKMLRLPGPPTLLTMIPPIWFCAEFSRFLTMIPPLHVFIKASSFYYEQQHNISIHNNNIYTHT